jgi:putative endonuclease
MSDFLSIDFQNNHSTNTNSSYVGQFGEELAAQFLVRRGYRLVIANFKVPIGRNMRGVSVSGEIDLIALEEKKLCFIEVKTRSSDQFAAPIAAVDLRKQRQITRTARVYRKLFNTKNEFRYDVVSIVLNKSGKPKIELFQNFWTEAKFRKKLWNDEIW